MGATAEEYFAYEEGIEGYAEYFDGSIFDMSGGSDNHSLVSLNLSSEIHQALKGTPCRVYNSDFSLAIEKANAFVRPDVWVICGPSEYSHQRTDRAKNALMVAEVLSESTSNYDRSGKFSRYRMVPSLREYVLIEQDHQQVDIYFLNDQGIWEFNSVSGEENVVRFQSLNISIALKDIYANVTFP